MYRMYPRGAFVCADFQAKRGESDFYGRFGGRGGYVALLRLPRVDVLALGR